MGSPYSVHRHVNRIHVVKTAAGLGRVLAIVQNSMGLKTVGNHINLLNEGPEWRVIRDMLVAYREAYFTHSRQVVFLEARYEWTGWEKFQRVVIFDNCRDTFTGLNDALVYHYCSDLLDADINVAP